ncbi:ExbD/TolR family protein [Aridibaculum aurantiacum]|uniref:ExbD/TolR family protein n=1 Tax=Aridibaculum aurantiacum TaxID=2810307 RepID=UPI001A961304|nr:biopolymer transporter ExbD [Aridibaculum aurantiacum]
MAEITSTIVSRNITGVRRSKKLSTRVDLTPMVDLGFLLITFFIFTTTMSESKATTLIMPDDSKPVNSNKHPEHKTITFILGENNSVFYYPGTDLENMVRLINPNDIRNYIISKKQQLAQVNEQDDLLVLIKPTTESTFLNIVDVLDEMLINDVKKYMIVENDEQEVMQQKKVAL